MPNRSYTSPLRAAEAAKTRAAILDAATTLFGRDGYIATTMKGIAVEAGVSVQSVHLAGSKAELLIGAFERSFAGNEGRESLTERPAIVDIMSDPDAARALSRWVDFVVDANRRSAGLSRAMVTAAEADPVATAAVADLDARRRSDMAIAAAWAAGRDLISAEAQPGVADELGFLTGPETYAYLVDRTGWSHDRYREWLGARVDEVLLRGRGGN
jgi:AcrR family transcriptional regulator